MHAEDERNQYTTVIHQVANRLRRDATATGDGGAVAIGGQLLRTYDELVEFFFDRLTDEDAHRDWAGPVTGTGTINAFLRRLRSSLKPLRTIVRGDLADTPGRQVSTDNQQVTVVDLHNLPERAQRFVVGVVLAAETARKEAAGPGVLLFTMIDELNRYAPREGTSPIKEVLLDIAERGRSLRIILIGAQQTASEVERRIVANSSIKGRGPAGSCRGGTTRVRLPAAADRVGRPGGQVTVELERSGMRFSVDPWDPGYGASLDVEELGESSAPVVADVELPEDRWRPLDGMIASPALCASYAAGVVCCCAGKGRTC
ncbi:MAG TPA: hypothetical protein VNA67_01420 [Pseudonocardiaceae bacterium]|nr:hypothetical protein [Pseudonocardiaceae bacterium]